MPRLIPRLVQALRNAPLITAAAESSSAPIQRPNPRPKSQWVPPPPPPNFSIEGRKKSFLLERNPIINRRIYRRHKTLPPVVRLGKFVKAGPKDVDKPRRMSVQERQWYSDPYLRMLSSTVRMCEYTQTHLPSDFMIRIARARVEQPSSARMSTIAIPDGIEHPKWQSRRSGYGFYMVCRREAAAEFFKKGSWHGSHTHSHLLQYITHLLQLRVLQEIEWLAEQLRLRPRGASDKPLLRRLTRAEWSEFRTTGVIPYDGAVAIIVVPPVNKNPETKKRPEPHSSSLPPASGEAFPNKPFKPLPPLSVLHPISSSEPEDGSNLGLHIPLPNPRVPLYNGPALMPSRPMRAALYEKLNHLLFVERRARWRQDIQQSLKSTSSPDEISPQLSRADEKHSHAYLLCSDAGSLLRADAVPLAIALWRLRMWEGEGWKEQWKFILPTEHKP
ncbi:hypothetical protein QCA50_000151 [Cerrena zonata]|uniref:Uncharacterized protein n=1 Tax=Cerrena zonata TaxID=2478898 RepID=A0AAW0GZD9_9APHY